MVWTASGGPKYVDGNGQMARHKSGLVGSANRLIRANIRTADELRDLWAPKRRRTNFERGIIALDGCHRTHDTYILDQYLQNNEGGDDLDEI